MPFVSEAQRGYMHAHPEVLGKKALHEWDTASKGQHVPEHVHHEHANTPYHLVRAERKKKNG